MSTSNTLALASFLLFLHSLIGSIGALVATQKGYNRFRWLLLGLLGGTPVFLIALTLKRKQ